MDTEQQILTTIKKLNDNINSHVEKYNKDIAFMAEEYHKILPELLLTYGAPLIDKEVPIGNNITAKITNVPGAVKIDEAPSSFWIKIPVIIPNDDRVYNLITAISLNNIESSIAETLQNATWRLTTPQDSYVTTEEIHL